MTFRVSPLAFFQVNTEGAELLYKAAIDMAKPDDNTTVLDVCCGTGTIGLSFSKVFLLFFLVFFLHNLLIKLNLFSIVVKFWAWK